ncbi:hypothetical protein Tco_0435804 [Tanacetum coccineum]
MKLTTEYCPKGEIKNFEIRTMELKRTKETDVGGSNTRKGGQRGRTARGSKQNQDRRTAFRLRIMWPVWECGQTSDCPVLKNQGTEARGMVYALRGGEANQDLDDMEDDINA